MFDGFCGDDLYGHPSSKRISVFAGWDGIPEGTAVKHPRGIYGGIFAGRPHRERVVGSPWSGSIVEAAPWLGRQRPGLVFESLRKTAEPSNKALHLTKVVSSLATFAGERRC